MKTVPGGGHSGERPKEKQSREEEAEGSQEEGRADGFAVCFNRCAGEAEPKRRSKENLVTSRPFDCRGELGCVRSGSVADVAGVCQRRPSIPTSGRGGRRVSVSAKCHKNAVS